MTNMDSNQELTQYMTDSTGLPASKLFHPFVGIRVQIYFFDAGLTYAYRREYLDFLNILHQLKLLIKKGVMYAIKIAYYLSYLENA